MSNNLSTYVNRSADICQTIVWHMPIHDVRAHFTASRINACTTMSTCLHWVSYELCCNYSAMGIRQGLSCGSPIGVWVVVLPSISKVKRHEHCTSILNLYIWRQCASPCVHIRTRDGWRMCHSGQPENGWKTSFEHLPPNPWVLGNNNVNSQQQIYTLDFYDLDYEAKTTLTVCLNGTCCLASQQSAGTGCASH